MKYYNRIIKIRNELLKKDLHLKQNPNVINYEDKKITDDVFNTLNQDVEILSSIETKKFKEKIKWINSRYNSLIELKKTKNSTHEIGPMFFCFEDMPPMGKEYWFMKFVSTKTKDKKQLLAM